MHIRWLIRADMPAVLDIENRSYDDPWTESLWIECLRQRNNIGMVVERDDVVVGYMAYNLQKWSLELLNFAVHPNSRRIGVGTAMIDKLKSKLSRERRSKLVANVADYNLDAQLFMKVNGFTAVATCRDFYERSYDGAKVDAYRFVYMCSVCLEV